MTNTYSYIYTMRLSCATLYIVANILFCCCHKVVVPDEIENLGVLERHADYNTLLTKASNLLIKVAPEKTKYFSAFLDALYYQGRALYYQLRLREAKDKINQAIIECQYLKPQKGYYPERLLLVLADIANEERHLYDAQELLEKALDIHKKKYSGCDDILNSIHSGLANNAIMLEDYNNAMQFKEKVFSCRGQVSRYNYKPFVDGYIVSSKIYYYRGNIDKAISECEEMIKFCSAPDVDEGCKIDALYHYASLLSVAGRQKDALDKAIEARRLSKIQVASHDSDRTPLSILIGTIYEKMGDSDNAEREYRSAICDSDRIYGGGNILSAIYMVKFGGMLMDKGDYQKGKALTENGKKIIMTQLGVSNAIYGSVLPIMRKYYQHERRIEEYIKSAKAQFEIIMDTYGGTHPAAIRYAIEYIILLCDNGEVDEAEVVIERMINVNKYNIRYSVTRLKDSVLRVASAFIDRGRHDDAVSTLEKYLENIQEGTPGESLVLAEVLVNLGATKIRQGNMKYAAELLCKAIITLEKAKAGNHQVAGDAMMWLGGVYYSIGNIEDADRWLRSAIEIYENSNAIGTRNYINANSLLSRARIAQKRYSESESLLLRAIGIAENYTMLNGDMVTLLEELAVLYDVMKEKEKANIIRSKIKTISEEGKEK